LAAIGVLIAVHLTAGYVDRWQGRGKLLFFSAAAGVSVAYTVMQLLPQLSRSDRQISAIAREYLPLLERHGYFLAVVGIVVFYANAVRISRSRGAQIAQGRADQADRRAFATSMVLMSIFNMMVAYSITDPNDPEIQPIVLFVVALALFYFVADVALHSSYKQEYHRVGRWILVGALLVGWLVGTKFEVSVTVIASFVAFFAGGILVTGLGNELRTGLSRKVWAFGIAAIAYSFLMMLLQPA
jgi:hypothetical protein